MVYNTLSALRRADQLYYEQISARQTLEYGLAFYTHEFSEAPGDNAFREVLVPDSANLPDAWTEAESFFTEQGLICRRWVPSADQDGAVLEPFLHERGFRARRLAALSLADWPALQPRSDIRVLPARAMRRTYRELVEHGENVDLAERRLDYPQFDMYVAVLDGRPVGRCGLFQAGEIGDVRDVYVVPPHRRQGIGTAMLAEALALARRLMMRIVVAKAPAEAQAAVSFLAHCGFVHDGELVEFDRSQASDNR